MSVRQLIMMMTTIFACFSTSPLRAEQPVSIPEIVVTATRYETDSFEVPNAVSVVEPEVAKQPPGTVPELLRGQPGVFIQQTTPGQGTPIIRGLIGSSILVMVDGMRLNSAFFRPAPNQYSALVDPYNVDYIEILRGSGSTLYGSDAMGGVVNILTPTPHFDGEEWQASARVLAQFSSTNLGRATRFSVAGGKEGVSLSAGATYQGFEDLRTGDGSKPPSAYDVYAGDGKLFYETDTQDFLFSVQYLRQPETPRVDELITGFGQDQPSSAVFSFEPNDRLFLHGRYRLFESIPAIESLEAHLSFQEINDDRRTRDFGSTFEFLGRNRSRSVGVSLQAISPWDDWMLLSYGVDTYFDHVASSQVQRDIVTGEVAPTQSRFADGSTMTSVGVYLQNELQLTNRLTTTLGARISYFDLHIPTADRGVGNDRDIFDITGSLSLIYELLPSLKVMSNVGRGFRAPNIFDLSTLGPRPGNRFNIPNPDLSSEEVFGLDVGLKVQTEQLHGEFFAFYSDYNDRITALATGDTTPDGRMIVQSENLGELQLTGIESSGHYILNDNWEIYGNINFTWAEQKRADGTTEAADRIPPLNGLSGIACHPSDTLSFSSEILWAADQGRLSERDSDDPRINPNGSSGWITWDASGPLEAD